MKVGLFIPCYVNLYYPQVGIATVEVLEKLGYEVDYPDSQTCCGQPLANAGYESIAKTSDDPIRRSFEDLDIIVSPSGSCVMHIQQHVETRKKFMELSDFLVNNSGTDNIKGSFPHKVGIHGSCHGLRGLRLGAASELQIPHYNYIHELLSQLEGIRFAELNRPDECCGFGGTFAVHEEEISVSMGMDRLMDHLSTHAEVVTASDMSCLMHLAGLAKRKGLQLEFRHFAEILNEAMS